MTYSYNEAKELLNMNFSDRISKQASLIADEIEQENQLAKIAEFYSDYGLARAESDIAKLIFSRFEKTASEEEQEEKEKELEEEKEKDFEDVDEETIKEASVYADCIVESYFERLADRGATDFNDSTHYFDVISKVAGIPTNLPMILENKFVLGKGDGRDSLRKQRIFDYFSRKKQQIKDMASGVKDFVSPAFRKAKSGIKNIDDFMTSPIENKIKKHYLNKAENGSLSEKDIHRYKNRKNTARLLTYGGLGVGGTGVGIGATAALRQRKNND